MTTEQIPPSEDADVKDLNTHTSQGEESAQPVTGSDATDSADSSRESLIQSLIQKPVEDPVEEAEKEEEVSDEDDAEEPEGEAEPTKKVETEDTPKSSAGADLEADKRLSERTRKTISDLRKAAAFGDIITQTLTNAKMTPDEFTRWTALAAQVKRGDPEAIGVLIATAKQFGYKEPTVEAAPKQKSVDDIAKDIYEAEFKADVDDLQIGEQVAKRQARRLAELQNKAEKPVPEPEQPRQQQRERIDPIREAAIQRVTQMENDYVRQNPAYAKVAPAVNARLAQISQSDPMMWPAQYQDIVREELRKASPPVAKKAITPVAGMQLRSSVTPAPTPVALSHSQQLVRDLMANKFTRP